MTEGFAQPDICYVPEKLKGEKPMNLVVQGEYGCRACLVNCEYSKRMRVSTSGYDPEYQIGRKDKDGWVMNAYSSVCILRLVNVTGSDKLNLKKMPKFNEVMCLKANFT